MDTSKAITVAGESAFSAIGTALTHQRRSGEANRAGMFHEERAQLDRFFAMWETLTALFGRDYVLAAADEWRTRNGRCECERSGYPCECGTAGAGC